MKVIASRYNNITVVGPSRKEVGSNFDAQKLKDWFNSETGKNTTDAAKKKLQEKVQNTINKKTEQKLVEQPVEQTQEQISEENAVIEQAPAAVIKNGNETITVKAQDVKTETIPTVVSPVEEEKDSSLKIVVIVSVSIIAVTLIGAALVKKYYKK